MNPRIREKLVSMAENPKAQLIQLVAGTIVSLLSMFALVLTSDWENQWVFYLLNALLIAGVIYAIPGYVGIWLWRMKDSLFRNSSSNRD